VEENKEIMQENNKISVNFNEVYQENTFDDKEPNENDEDTNNGNVDEEDDFEEKQEIDVTSFLYLEHKIRFAK